MDNNSIFEEFGFFGSYRSDFEKFYRPFFPDEAALNSFFCAVVKNSMEENKPRWILNDIFNFITLANDIEQIRPGRDPLKILFLRICLESICKDSDSKPNVFFDSFDDYFSNAGKQYIQKNYIFTGILTPKELEGLERVSFNKHYDYKLTCKDFLKIMKATRNNVAHGGDYWLTQFFTPDPNTIYCTELITDNQIIPCQVGQKNKFLTYCFHTTMQYEKFIFYFTEACINYLRNYIKSL